jgi:S1-C subfamily serine protease
MKKAVLIGCLFLSILFTACAIYIPQFAPESVIARVKRHTVSIAVYYVMDTDTHRQFMADESKLLKIPNEQQGQHIATAVIGSGTILKKDYVVTVRHLFDDHYGISPSDIYVFIPGWDHVVEADLVCKSDEGTFWDDYAVIKLREKTKLPGLRIAEEQPKTGDKVMASGSTGGFAFFTRFLRVTELRWYFNRGYDGILHLTPWEDFPYMTVYPGGPGDSGGSICNVKGELAGIMYCGLTNYSEEYVFANPLVILKDFLLKNNLGNLL